jgi:type IV pilus assembly protein PilP
MRILLLVAVVVWNTAAVVAQSGAQPQTPQAPASQPSPASQASAGQAPASAGQAQPAAPESQGFTYNPEGRRDPFVSLLRRGGTGLGPTIGGVRPPGLGGLETAEVTLKGTVQSQGGFVGILLGADQKTYIVRAGDRLLDGTVRSITQNALVILQQVNDPLSLEKQREVRKVLRQIDEAK